MAPLKSIVEKLKGLPPVRLEAAAKYIEKLEQENEEEQIAILRSTAGCLTSEEADELMRTLEAFETVDETSWCDAPGR